MYVFVCIVCGVCIVVSGRREKGDSVRDQRVCDFGTVRKRMFTGKLEQNTLTAYVYYRIHNQIQLPDDSVCP